MSRLDRPLILLAGGAGYIGLHVSVELLEAGFDVLIVDDFSNAPRGGPAEAARIAGRAPGVVAGDLRDRAMLRRLFDRRAVDAVVLLAGLKSAPASVADPVGYYDVNLGIALSLLAEMLEAGVRRLVFSSSAAVYGARGRPPFAEDAPRAPANPYGRTKLAVERILQDAATAREDLRILSLRYFNPVGAHPAGGLAESPRSPATNLFPLMVAAMRGGRPLTVFGDDWPTRDGSCIRDYIHVVDLARGHVAAVERLLSDDPAWAGHTAMNLGRGRGDTVFEAIEAFSAAAGRAPPYRIAGRRPGDVAVSVADSSLARERLGWRAELNLHDMCRDLCRRDRPQVLPSAAYGGTEAARP